MHCTCPRTVALHTLCGVPLWHADAMDSYSDLGLGSRPQVMDLMSYAICYHPWIAMVTGYTHILSYRDAINEG